MAIVDKKTPRLGLLLPNADNFLQDDVERLIQSFDLLDVLVVMRDQTTGKIADDQLSAVIARLDAQGKLSTSALPSSVVQKGADGKIDASVLPSIAIIDSYPVPNEASMLGLQCERGDIAIRTDLGRSFILTDLPPSKLSNWRELTSTNVTSVNGQVGAITGLAKAGVNDDITSLTALSGPLRLGGEAAGDYDAVTLKQLRAASGGAGGASMNGVMNNFIGAVEWFNGTRAKLPAGYIAADGQIVSRTDPATADLWAAVNAGIYASAATDAAWLNSGIANAVWNNRGMYSPGDGSTTFRIPDLNSQFNDPSQNWTPQGLFLRSHGRLTGNGVGNIIENAAPNITGQMTSIAQDLTIGTFIAAQGAFKVGGLNEGRISNPATIPQAASPYVNLDASQGGTTAYGRNGTAEVRPNAALGIWIIRASGLFTAQNTVFEVQTSDAAFPGSGVVAKGGALISRYTGYNVGTITSSVQAAVSVGGKVSTTYLYSDATGVGGEKGTFSFDSDGRFNAAKATIAGELIAGSCRVTGDLSVQGELSPRLLAQSWSTARAMVKGSVSTDNVDTYAAFVQGTYEVPSKWTLIGSLGYYGGATGDPNLGGMSLVVTDFASYSARWLFRNSGTISGPAGDILPGTSDAELKDKTENASDGAETRIMKLRPREFDWKADGRHDRGFIAQEAMEADPLYAFKLEGSQYYNLSDRAIMADMVSVIQSMSRRLAVLEGKK